MASKHAVSAVGSRCALGISSRRPQVLQTSLIPVDSHPPPPHGCPSSCTSSRWLSPAFHPGSQPQLFLPTPLPHPQIATTFCLSVPFKNLSWIRPFFSVLRDTVSVWALIISCLDRYSHLSPGFHPSPSPVCLFCFCQQLSSLWRVNFVRCPPPHSPQSLLLQGGTQTVEHSRGPPFWPPLSLSPAPTRAPRAPAPLTFPAPASALCPCVVPPLLSTMPSFFTKLLVL